MKYFAALKVDAMIHVAVTRYDLAEWVQVDLERDEVFAKFYQQAEVVLFKLEDAEAAKERACKEYAMKAVSPSNSSRFFKEEETETQSTDARLIRFYGSKHTRMRKEAVIISYMIEVNDEIELQENMDGPGYYLLRNEDKNKLVVGVARIENMSVFRSDEIAKQTKFPTVTRVDHAKRSENCITCNLL